MLFNQLKLHNLWTFFCSFVVGFCDTLPFFKRLFPDAENHKQVTIVHKVLGESYVAHDAMEDCKMLQKVVDRTSKQSMLLKEHYFEVTQVSCNGVQPKRESVEWLCKRNIISKATEKKINRSSLTYEHLKLACQRDGFDGLYFLLSESLPNTGKPRVTRNQKVVQKLANYFLFTPEL